MRKKPWWNGVAGSVASAIIMLLTLATAPSALAHAADGHPARIQQGICDNLAGIAFQLTGVGATITPDGTPVPPPAMVGATVADPLQMSGTTLQTSLTQLTQNPYAIVIYESDDAMDHIIACGNIGGMLTAQMPGMIMPGDVLPVWLADPEDAGTAGMAILQADGVRVIVHLYLAAREGGHDAPTDAEFNATPHSGQARNVAPKHSGPAYRPPGTT